MSGSQSLTASQRSESHERTLLRKKNPSKVSARPIAGIVQQSHPEYMSVFDQIAIFRNNTVYGFVGSAFHNSVFSFRPKGLCFSMHSWINRSFALFDHAVESQIQYCKVEWQDVATRHGFFDSREVLDLTAMDRTVAAYQEGNFESGLSYFSGPGKNGYDPGRNGPFILVDIFGRQGIIDDEDEPVVAQPETSDRPWLKVYLVSDVALFCHGHGTLQILGRYALSNNEDHERMSFRDISTGLFLSIEDRPQKNLLSNRRDRHGWEWFTLKSMPPDNAHEEEFYRVRDTFLGC